MNIFKILANGKGSVNEENISAFLGYLLDPSGDHGLRHEFIKRFLGTALEDDISEHDDFVVEQYDYQIYCEQQFEAKNKSEIIDIVIVAYAIDQGDKKRSQLKSFLESKKEIKKLFLIENKIRNASKNAEQLQRQFKAVKSYLGDTKYPIHSIYVTPETSAFKEEFDSADDIPNKTHILWNSEEEDNLSIKLMLMNLLQGERKCEIEPLNSYTSQTIKAFIQFIATDFRSEKAEEKRRREPSQARLDAEELNQRMKVEDHLLSLRQNIATSHPAIADNLSLPDLSNPGFPKLEIACKGIILQVAAFSGTREKVSFWFTIDRNVAESRQHLEILATKTDLELKKPNDTYGSYIRTEEMKKHIPFSDPDKIVEVVKNSLDLVDKHLA